MGLFSSIKMPEMPSFAQPQDKGFGMTPIGTSARTMLANPPPKLENAELDEGTKNLMAQQMAKANESEGDIAKGWLSGAKEGGQDVFGGGQKPNSMGGNLPAGYQEALGRRANKKYEQDFNKLERQARLNASAEKARRLQQVSDMYSKKQINIINDTSNYNKSILETQKARNGVINGAVNNIFSGVGSVFGMMKGGGGGGGQQASSDSGNKFVDYNSNSGSGAGNGRSYS